MNHKRLPLIAVLSGVALLAIGLIIIPRIPVASPLSWDAYRTYQACQGYAQLSGTAANGAMYVESRDLMGLAGLADLLGLAAIVTGITVKVRRRLQARRLAAGNHVMTTVQAAGHTGADRASQERGALVTHLGEVIADLREAGVLHDECWALADLKYWLTDASGITFRSYITSLGSALPPGFPQ
jgi:hypothetical protein